MNIRRKKGFTLVELLVVCAIMAIIVAITVPTVIHHVKRSQDESDKTIHQTIVNNVYKCITQLQIAQRPITTDSVIAEVYPDFNGSYNAAAPHASVRASCPYVIVPKDDAEVKVKHALIEEGKYFEVEFIGYTDIDGNIVSGAFRVLLKDKDNNVIIDSGENTVKGFIPNKDDCTAKPLA